MPDETPNPNVTPAAADAAAQNLSLMGDAGKAAADAGKADAGKAAADAGKAEAGKEPAKAGDGTSKKDETNLTEEQKLALEKQKALDAAKANAPEKYADFKMPEGFKADDKLMGEFQKTAKEFNMSQDKAQKMIDMASGLAADIMAKQSEAQATQITTWKQEISADKEFGGANLQKTLQLAQRGLEKYGDEALKKVVKETGWGSHPGFIKTFARIGQTMSEDTTVSGDGAAAKRSSRSMAETIYDGK